MTEEEALLTVSDGTRTITGQFVLVGNGCQYGGPFHIFPEAELSDGWLHVCVFSEVGWLTLIRCGLALLITKKLPTRSVIRLRAKSFTLIGQSATHFEVDGELGGPLPARIALKPAGLRVIVP